MDTSEQYIKMCEKAKELRAIHRPSKLTTTVYRLGEQMFSVEGHNIAEVKDLSNFGGTHYVWLPSQDELQEMVFGQPSSTQVQGLTIPHETEWQDTLPKLMMFAYNLNTEWNTVTFSSRVEYNSMEQLWLAFVMKEKYAKVWNGEKWNGVE